MELQAGEVFLGDDVLPPIVAGAAKLLPSVGDNLVEGILDQTGEIGCGGQVDPVRIETPVEITIPGEHEVELTNTGKFGNFQALELLFTRGIHEIIDRCLELVFFVEHAGDAAGALNGQAGRQF